MSFSSMAEVCYSKPFSKVVLSLFPPGNRALLPAPKTRVQSEPSESGNLIVFNGAMVDIASMMQKLEKSEKAREEIEQKLLVLDAKMGMILYCIILYMLSLEVISYSHELQSTLCVRSPSGQ